MVPQMSFVDAVKTCVMEKYFFKFEGRARRSEYWWFALATGLLSCALQMCGKWGAILGSIAMLALLPATWGVAVRRMHDIGKSGWALLISLIPLVGAIILLVWSCKDSQQNENQYGPSPKYQA